MHDTLESPRDLYEEAKTCWNICATKDISKQNGTLFFPRGKDLEITWKKRDLRKKFRKKFYQVYFYTLQISILITKLSRGD